MLGTVGHRNVWFGFPSKEIFVFAVWRRLTFLRQSREILAKSLADLMLNAPCTGPQDDAFFHAVKHSCFVNEIYFS